MTYTAGENAIRSTFSTGWGATSPVDYGVAGTFTKPTDFSPWVRFTVLYDPSNQVSIGATNRLFRRRGLVEVQIFVKEGAGPAARNALIDAVVLIFEGLRITSPDVRFFGDTTPRFVGADGSGWEQVNVTAQFEFDDVK